MSSCWLSQSYSQFTGGQFRLHRLLPNEKYDGVIDAVSGYTGGHVENPSYKQVCSHSTGHLEAVEVSYDANLISYNDLLEIFWRTIDPTDAGGSFYDRGEPYTSAIFVSNDSQRELAEQSKSKLASSGLFEEEIATVIRDAATFYQAEDYHQNYYLTHPVKYSSYRYGSGRDSFIASVWGDDAKYKVAKMKSSESEAVPMEDSFIIWTDQPVATYANPADADLKSELTQLQYRVTQHEGTERPFSNTFWKEKRDGIYVDVVSGEPLFGSGDKFASGTGCEVCFQSGQKFVRSMPTPIWDMSFLTVRHRLGFATALTPRRCVLFQWKIWKAKAMVFSASFLNRPAAKAKKNCPTMT